MPEDPLVDVVRELTRSGWPGTANIHSTWTHFDPAEDAEAIGAALDYWLVERNGPTDFTGPAWKHIGGYHDNETSWDALGAWMADNPAAVAAEWRAMLPIARLGGANA